VLALSAAALLAAALRAPFLGAGIEPDEGGYAYIAREWSRGAHLYGDVWVDRPQGLLVAYRFMLSIGDHPWAVRLGALLAGAAIAALVGVIAWLLFSRAAGIAAAAIYAVVGVGPHIEGFTFNGELAAALPATAAVASAAAWYRRRHGAWLVCAGVMGGLAILMKQSGADGLVVALLVAAAVTGALRERIVRAGLVVAGAALPLAASVLHGLVLGWSGYWRAVVGFQAGQSLPLASRPDRFAASLAPVEQDLLALACVALVGVVACIRRRNGPWGVPLVWLALAFAALNTGGNYWPHYFVQLVPPLALLGAVGATAFRSRLLAVGMSAVAVAPVLVTLVSWSPPEASFHRDELVARFVTEHSTRANTIYAIDSEADLYYLANRRAPEPYVWRAQIRNIPGALDGLRRVIADPGRRPKLIVEYRDPTALDGSGRLSKLVKRHYRPIWRAPVKGRQPLVLVARITVPPR
jgi:4-amino-4-deoxy-L-arabinose transferase-like glycosyltransferase